MAESRREELKSYYAVLGVQPDATPDEIRAAYRRLAKKYHPDRNRGDARAEERFKRIGEAYRILSDPTLRLEHHSRQAQARKRKPTSASQQQKPPPQDQDRGEGGGFSEFFKNVFSKGFGTESRPEEKAAEPTAGGSDLRITLEVDSIELDAGARRTVKYKRKARCEVCGGKGLKPGTARQECSVCQGLGEVPRSRGGKTVFDTCPNCKGSGSIIRDRCIHCGGRGVTPGKARLTINIPPGTRDGAVLTIPGQGNAGGGGGQAGDLKVHIHETENRYFVRRGNDLVYDYPLDASQILAGGVIEVPSHQGKVRLTLTPGLPPGKILRVKGRGLPSGEGERGDLLVRLQYYLPEEVSEKAGKLLRDLLKQPGWSPPRDEEGFSPRG